MKSLTLPPEDAIAAGSIPRIGTSIGDIPGGFAARPECLGHVIGPEKLDVCRRSPSERGGQTRERFRAQPDRYTDPGPSGGRIQYAALYVWVRSILAGRRQGLKRILVILAVVAIGLVLAAAASGGNSIVNGHTPTPPASSNLGASGSNTPSGTGSSSPSGTLPFTGLDLGGIAIVGALLVGGGLILRRQSRRTN